MRSGSYSEALAALKEENERARERYERARSEARGLEKEAAEKKREASRTRARLSKRGVAHGDQDSKSKIDAARISGKDAVSARKYREAAVRLDRAEDAAQRLAVGRARAPGLRLRSQESSRDTLFHLDACRVPLGAAGADVLSVPDLVIYPADRIGLTGPNGSGKSTLIRKLVAAIAGLSVLYLPQEIDAESSRRILQDVKKLSGEVLGRVMTAVERLGTDPERVLSTDEPSPGEIRKVLIARGIAETPELIIMDEPTNHLDLPSIECLTEALKRCACGLLLASHDARFLADVTAIRWRIQPEAGQDGTAFRLESSPR